MGIQYRIIDPYQSNQWQNIGVNHLAQAGFAERFTLLEEPSELCLPRLLAEGLTLDFAFMDGFHRFDHALLDFFYINRMLAIGGWVAFDDIELPAVQKVIAHIRTYPCCKDA